MKFLFLFLAVVVSGTLVPFEKMYHDAGYKSVKKSKKECESLFGKDIILPTIEPPISFTHHFGRCNDSEGEMNDHFEMDILNQHKPENHYLVRVNPIQQKIKGFPREEVQHYTLSDGSRAIYGATPRNKIFRVLVFEKGDWQYILSIDSRVSNTVTPEELIRIANSIPSRGKPIKDISYNHNCLTLDNAQKKIDFKLIVPKVVPEKWTLDTKDYPEGEDSLSLIRMHFMDEEDQELIVAIEEQATLLKRVPANGDIGEKVRISWRYSGRFEPWANHTPGGILRWIQEGTLIEMHSGLLTKKEMIELASGMVPL